MLFNLLEVATEKEARNREYQTKELCPIAKFCVYKVKHETCRGRENYEQCLFYKEVIRSKEEYLKDEVIRNMNKRNRLVYVRF